MFFFFRLEILKRHLNFGTCVRTHWRNYAIKAVTAHAHYLRLSMWRVFGNDKTAVTVRSRSQDILIVDGAHRYSCCSWIFLK